MSSTKEQLNSEVPKDISLRLSMLSYVGIVLKDAKLVFVSEFLEWLNMNLRRYYPPQYDPENLVLVTMNKGLDCTMEYLSNPNDQVLNEKMRQIRFQATQLQSALQIRVVPSARRRILDEGDDLE